MDRMDEAWLLEHVRARVGGRARECRRAVLAVLESLSSTLEPPARRILAQALPSALAVAVDPGPDARELDLDAFYAAVERRARLTRSHAIEAVQAVLGTLAGGLPEDVATLVRKELTPSVAGRFGPEATEPEPPPHVRVHPPWTHVRPPTLSTGRPGSSDPVAESRPERAQRGSVVASANPHGDTKLSTAHGTTQEQDDRTLSEAGTSRR